MWADVIIVIIVEWSLFITESSVPSGRAVVSADSGGELYDSAELPRNLPAAGRQAESIWWTERAAEVPGCPGAHCVSTLAWFPDFVGTRVL